MSGKKYLKEVGDKEQRSQARTGKKAGRADHDGERATEVATRMVMKQQATRRDSSPRR